MGLSTTVRFNGTTRHRDQIFDELAELFNELGIEEKPSFHFETPCELRVTASAGIGGKTFVIFTFTTEHKRT
jgi:hypothetical protein